MRDTMIIAGAVAMTLAQLAPAAVMAQPTDKMARPLPAPIVDPVRPQPVRPLPVRPQPLPVRPQPQPVRPLPQPVPDRPGGWYGGNNGGNWNGGGWNGQTIRCESQNGRRNYCRADTRGGVRLVRQLSNTPCREGRTWGTSNNSIWVDNGCRGEFQLRYGSGQSGSSGGGGPSAGAIIGGVAVAGGLIALLSQAGKDKAPPANTTGNVAGPPLANDQQFNPPAAPTGPARITAQTGGVTPDARPSLQTCLNEAARQIGATGGTEIIMDRIDDIEKGNGGFRFRFQLKAVYPDETRTISTFCRATPTTLVELTFG